MKTMIYISVNKNRITVGRDNEWAFYELNSICT